MEKYLKMLESMGISNPTAQKAQWNDCQAKKASQNVSSTFELFTLVKSEDTAYSAGMNSLSQEIYNKVGTTRA